jgi:hypothetical protein
MLPFVRRGVKAAGLARRARGQAMTEYVALTAALLVTGVGIMAFAPDMMAAFTIYIRGFYLILGLPIG